MEVRVPDETMEAIVEYNYVAQEEDELTLRKGDIITGIKMMLGGWWEGTLRDKRGMFPDNFVKVLISIVPSLAHCLIGCVSLAADTTQLYNNVVQRLSTNHP